MKVLSVIIAHPLRKVSGATNAGRELSIATARLTDLELAIMWDANELSSVGPLGIRHMKSTNLLGPFAPLAPRFIRVPLYASRIPDLIRDGSYDLVHIHNLIPAFAAEGVARACRQMDVPYVISTHGFDEISRYSQINGFGPIKSALADVAITRPFRRVVRGASALFALSDCELPLLSSLGVDSRHVHVVTNGVNEFFLQDPPAADLEAIRRKYHLGSDPVVLFFGSLHAYKGVDTFLASLAKVEGRFQPIVAGRFKDAREKQQILRKSGLPDALASRVVFTGGVTDDELRSLYHLASVFVYPTRGDTLPLVLLEAMACRKPVISTPTGGIPFVVRSETGCLIEPGNPEAVARSLTFLLADPDLRRRMGAAGRIRVEQKFRWGASAAHAVEAYHAVLERLNKKTRASVEASYRAKAATSSRG